MSLHSAEQIEEAAHALAPSVLQSGLRELVPVLQASADATREALEPTGELLETQGAGQDRSQALQRITTSLLRALSSIQRLGSALDEHHLEIRNSKSVVGAAASLEYKLRDNGKLVDACERAIDTDIRLSAIEDAGTRSMRAMLCSTLSDFERRIMSHAANVRGPLGVKAAFSRRAKDALIELQALQASIQDLQSQFAEGPKQLPVDTTVANTSLAPLCARMDELAIKNGGLVMRQLRDSLTKILEEENPVYFRALSSMQRRDQSCAALASAQEESTRIFIEIKEFLAGWPDMVETSFLPELHHRVDLDERALRIRARVDAFLEAGGVTVPYSDADKEWVVKKRKYMWESPEEGVIAHASIRSYENIRKSLELFLTAHMMRRGGELEMENILQDLREEEQQVRESFFVEYRAHCASLKEILASRALRSLRKLHEIAHAQGVHASIVQHTSTTGTDGFAREARRTFEDSLLEGEHALYAMLNTTTKPVDADVARRPGSQYGPIRFIFDWDAIASRTLFTESDSLNPSGLSYSLGSKMWKGAPDRQLVAEHALMSQAILQQDVRHFPQESLRPVSNHGFQHRYVEAQIMSEELGLDGMVREVILDFRSNAKEFLQLTSAYADPTVFHDQIVRAAPHCRVSSQGLAELVTDAEFTKLCPSQQRRASLVRVWEELFPPHPLFSPP